MDVGRGKFLIRLGDVDDSLSQANHTDGHRTKATSSYSADQRNQKHDQALVRVTKIELVDT